MPPTRGEPSAGRRALTSGMDPIATDEITVTEQARAQLAAHLAAGPGRYIRIHVGRG